MPIIGNRFSRWCRVFLPVLVMGFPAWGEPLAPTDPTSSLGSGSGQLPEQEPLAPAVVEPVLPPVEAPGAEAPLSAGRLRVRVERFVIEGNTVFPAEELEALTIPYRGREVTSDELEELRRKLTRYYVERGYINSGVVLPDQRVADGVVHFKVVEGRLTGIELEGLDWLRPRYVLSRIEGDPAAPLRLDELQERLTLLKQDPLIKRIQARLEPGGVPGEAELKLAVEESRPWWVGFDLDNQRAPDIGGYRGKWFAAHRDLTGWGDTLAASYGITEGVDEYGVSYTVPLTRWGTTLKLAHDKNSAEVVAAPFDALAVESVSRSWEVALTQPLVRTPTTNLNLGLGLKQRKSETFLLGIPFSFAEGVEDGVSRETVVEFSQDWLSQSTTRVVAARSSFNWGIDALDATVHAAAPDSRFLTWLGQAQWVERWSLLDSTTVVKSSLRLADDQLLPLEKFAIGGVATVRGYRENQEVRDNGFLASAEWRVPVGELLLWGEKRARDDGVVRLAPFIDYGHAWNRESGEPPEPESLASIGLGVLWKPLPWVDSQLYWGFPLEAVADEGEHDLQDEGIHFKLSMRY